MVSNRFLPFFLLLLLFSNSAEGCQTHITFGYSENQCSFTVSYLPGDCYNFNFQQCHYRVCVLYDYGLEGGCYRYETRTSTSYDFCTRECCNPTVTYDQNWGAINQCQDHINNGFKITVIVIVVVVVIVALIFVAIFCSVYHKCCECGCCQSICFCFQGQVAEEESKQNVREVVVGAQVEFSQNNPLPHENVVTIAPRMEFNTVTPPPVKLAPLQPSTEQVNSDSKVDFNWTVEQGKEKGFFMCPMCMKGGASFKIDDYFYHKKCAIQLKLVEIEVRIYCLKCTTSYFCSTLAEVVKLKSKKELICGKCQDSEC